MITALRRTGRLSRAATGLALLAALTAACGGSGDQEGVASLASAAPDASTSAGPEGSDEEQALQFAQCMRDNGVSGFPDPTVDSDGNVGFGQPGAGGLGEVDQQVLQSAGEACEQYAGGLGGDFTPQDQSELQDTLLAYAGCMRENGYDLPDPDLGSGPGAGGAGAGGPFGGDVDREDPAFVSANTACEGELAGLGAGPGQ